MSKDYLKPKLNFFAKKCRVLYEAMDVKHELRCLLQCSFWSVKAMAIFYINDGILYYDDIPLKEKEVLLWIVIELWWCGSVSLSDFTFIRIGHSVFCLFDLI
jgi:hypothetical protein